MRNEPFETAIDKSEFAQEKNKCVEKTALDCD